MRISLLLLLFSFRDHWVDKRYLSLKHKMLWVKKYNLILRNLCFSLHFFFFFSSTTTLEFTNKLNKSFLGDREIDIYLISSVFLIIIQGACTGFNDEEKEREEGRVGSLFWMKSQNYNCKNLNIYFVIIK